MFVIMVLVMVTVMSVVVGMDELGPTVQVDEDRAEDRKRDLDSVWTAVLHCWIRMRHSGVDRLGNLDGSTVYNLAFCTVPTSRLELGCFCET